MLDDQAACYKALLPSCSLRTASSSQRGTQLSAGAGGRGKRLFRQPCLTRADSARLRSRASVSRSCRISRPTGRFVIAQRRIDRIAHRPGQDSRRLPRGSRSKPTFPPMQRRFLALEELICRSVDKLLPGMTILSAYALSHPAQRRSRPRRRRWREPARRRHRRAFGNGAFSRSCVSTSGPTPIRAVRRALMERFELTDIDVFELPGHARLSRPVPDRGDSTFPPCAIRRGRRCRSPGLPTRTSDIFAAIDAGDLLVHHPYESFDSSVERFIHQAADDPRTLAIKMTVYRVGDDTPFVRSLVQDRGSRQASRLRHRADGAIRRSAQPALGAAARKGRRTRHLRRDSASRRTPRSRWSCSSTARGCAATPTSAPATITSRRRASIPTSGC